MSQPPLRTALQRRATALSLATAMALALVACDTVTGEDDDGGNGGPSTVCDYNYENEDTTKLGIGEACTADDECAFGECMMPGEGGNGTNAVFGFCTRGCDCGDDASKVQSDNQSVYECIYPAGNEGAWRHVVLECSSVADCQAFASEWSECRSNPPTGTGTIKSVCWAE